MSNLSTRRNATLPALASFWDPLRLAPWWSENLLEPRGMAAMMGDFLDRWPAMTQGLLSGPFEGDVSEDERSVTVRMHVPGVSEDDIDITVEDGMLTVSADKYERKKGTESRYAFSSSLRLPESVDIDRADVRLAQQVLTIEIPKISDDRRKIAINKRDGGSQRKEASQGKSQGKNKGR